MEDCPQFPAHGDDSPQRDVHFCTRFGRRYSGSQSTDEIERGLRRIGLPAGHHQTESGPHIRSPRVFEALRQHPDDGIACTRDPERLPHHIRISGKCSPPQTVTDHQHPWPSDDVILSGQCPTEQRLDAEDTQEISDNNARTDRRRGVPDFRGDGPGAVVVDPGEVFESSALFSERDEIRVREGHVAELRLQVFGPNHYDAVLLTHRQSPQQHAIDDGEHRRGRTDPCCESDDCGEREPWILAQRAKREAEVLKQGVHDQVSVSGAWCQSTIHPSLNCTTLFPYRALSSECVTCTIVVPAALSSRNSSMISLP